MSTVTMENGTNNVLETKTQQPTESKSEQQKSQKYSVPLTNIPEDPTENIGQIEDGTTPENSKNLPGKGDNPNTTEIISLERTTEVEVDSLQSPMTGENKNESRPIISTKSGLHIALFSVICLPAAFVASLCVSFYYGASAWYNLYLYFSEEKTIWHKVFICPVLILTFPFTVGFSSVGVAVFAAFVQISWFYSSWRAEFLDFDKGFYGWLCNKLGLPQCCPYELITVNNESELEPMRTDL